MNIELRDRGEIPVRCGECGWDNDGRLTLVDRWVTDYPPVPYRGPMLEVYRDGDDPESRTDECGGCDGYLGGETVEEREPSSAEIRAKSRFRPGQRFRPSNTVQ